ncbi:MAG: glucose-6-phosphate dehydrogenase [Roseovarius sp.]|nr:glucose-6-phosphate dehydrogenase [Roseovarius sp.]MCY4314669.1 glucose-6-phosphate dehydrogenase [Roseovarius sp.]
MVSRIIPVKTFDLVIFGGTGDLARRKILPGLFRRFLSGQMNSESRIIGVARQNLDCRAYRSVIREAILENDSGARDKIQCLEAFLTLVSYNSIDAESESGWDNMACKMRNGTIHAYYFSVGPSLFDNIAGRLHRHGLVHEDVRIVVEKPFGHDWKSACALNRTLARHFHEHQIFRIDHYLGKETVQNLMALRFGNLLFEPLWNSKYVDHIQITVAESVGVGGRGDYYDQTGAMRDMVQNHIMQLLCMIAMEPPAKYDPNSMRDEKLKVIRCLDPVTRNDLVRGQYEKSAISGGYLDEAGKSGSTTESFIALKARISNWRWAGTPIYIRTGKRLKDRASEIAVVFKQTPHSIFAAGSGRHGNILAIKLQPNEGIELEVTIKEPGPGGMRLIEVPLDMTFADALGPSDIDNPDAYERLVMDVIRGDQTLFMRGDEVEAAWEWTDKVVSEWENMNEKPLPYSSGSSGPDDSLMLMHRDGRKWREIRA